MRAYRFRNERLYRRRRVFILTLLTVLILAAAYFMFRDNLPFVGSSPTPSPGNSASPTGQASPTPSETPTETPTPTPEPPNGTQTSDHGFLPAMGSYPETGKMGELETLIKDYIGKQSGKYGVTFIDLASGESVSIDDKVEYIAASTSKLPMNVLLYTKIASGEIDPDSKLQYLKEDFEAGTGVIQNSAYGTEYTVRETSRLSVVTSDNCGINMIIRTLGIENIRQYILDLGGVVYYGKTHRSCPYDMALVSQELYRLYLEKPEVYGELITNLENTNWSDRIDAQLPDSVKVAHKIGNQTRTANDVGIVFASRPYVLSVMTDDVDFGTACTKIAELSRMIYDFVEEYHVSNLP